MAPYDLHVRTTLLLAASLEILDGRVLSVVYSLVAGPCCILGSKG